jgi:hypothetical protein
MGNHRIRNEIKACCVCVDTLTGWHRRQSCIYRHLELTWRASNKLWVWSTTFCLNDHKMQPAVNIRIRLQPYSNQSFLQSGFYSAILLNILIKCMCLFFNTFAFGLNVIAFIIRVLHVRVHVCICNSSCFLLSLSAFAKQLRKITTIPSVCLSVTCRPPPEGYSRGFLLTFLEKFGFSLNLGEGNTFCSHTCAGFWYIAGICL